MLRTVKLCLEARIQKRIPDDHPLMTWMVEHAAWLSTVCKRGEDGKTAFQRVRGRAFNKRSVEFGEKCCSSCRTEDHGTTNWEP